jgi:hypothetical protein
MARKKTKSRRKVASRLFPPSGACHIAKSREATCLDVAKRLDSPLCRFATSKKNTGLGSRSDPILDVFFPKGASERTPTGKELPPKGGGKENEDIEEISKRDREGENSFSSGLSFLALKPLRNS